MTALVDVFRPTKRTIVFDLLSVLLGSLLIALLAQVAFNLPWTPVPFSLQTLGVLLVGALLGSERGALAVIANLAQGAMGLPVFAGGLGGLHFLLGPTGGYLLGFVACAYAVGFFLERGWRESYSLTLLAMVLGSLFIYATGILWLGFYVGFQHVLAMGVLPFLMGDLIKIVIAATLIPSGWKLLNLFQ